MKFTFFSILFIPVFAFAGELKVCNIESDSKSFITDWRSGNNKVQVLSTQSGSKFFIDDGSVIFNDDLDGDGNNDIVFEATTGAGSSKDRVYSILLQCHGYLKIIGSNYFADVEVMSDGDKGGFKYIKTYSYERNAKGNVKYNGKNAVMVPHIWHFNPTSQKYEGKPD